MIKITLGILVLVGVISGLILLLMHFREIKIVSGEFFTQITVAIISGGMIAVFSFFSAYALYKIEQHHRNRRELIQEEQRVKDIRIDSFNRILSEESENRMKLQMEMKRDRPFIRLPLKTSAWESGKYQTPIETEMLIDGLVLLYNDIEKYNWSVEFMRHKMMVDGLTKDKVPEKTWKSTESILTELSLKLVEFEKLLSRESVLLKLRTKEAHEKRFGKWEDTVSISYFITPQNKVHTDILPEVAS